MSKSFEDDPLKAWKLTFEEMDEIFLTGNSVDSSAAWYHFEDFFASRGYDLRYNVSPIGSPDDERTKPRRPQVNFDGGLGNPFKPCLENNIPFVFHDPTKYTKAFERFRGTWKMTVTPHITCAYDKYNRLVIIKALPIPNPSAEIRNLMQLNVEPLRSCPDNHTIPVLEHIVSDEGWQFLVMPAWKMHWNRRMKAWDVEDYFTIATQLLEGLAFMHKNGFVHCDISVQNVAFNTDRTAAPDYHVHKRVISRWDFRVAYIDFGFSLKFDPSTDSSTWMSTSGWGTWPHISPEKEVASKTSLPYKALPADVYALGALFKDILDIEADSIEQTREFTGQSETCPYAHDVLKCKVPEYEEVLQKMMDDDPDERPTAQKTLQLFRNIQENLPHHIRFAPPDGYPASILTSEGHNLVRNKVNGADLDEDVMKKLVDWQVKSD